jgi:hypothetical protein
MEGVEERVEAPEAALGDEAVLIDPGGEAFERGGVEVHGAALGVAGARDEAGLLEHVDVLGDGLFGDGEGFGELVDGGVAAREARDEGASDRVGEGHEGAVELRVARLSPGCLQPVD